MFRVQHSLDSSKRKLISDLCFSDHFQSFSLFCVSLKKSENRNTKWCFWEKEERIINFSRKRVQKRSFLEWKVEDILISSFWHNVQQTLIKKVSSFLTFHTLKRQYRMYVHWTLCDQAGYNIIIIPTSSVYTLGTL